MLGFWKLKPRVRFPWGEWPVPHVPLVWEACWLGSGDSLTTHCCPLGKGQQKLAECWGRRVSASFFHMKDATKPLLSTAGEAALLLCRFPGEETGSENARSRE